ncbi:probable inactive 1-aminocyclopropane-1-carboxylate synthase-like protein 2 [Erinaceus europaeus]|uniref:Probable inactive 1-aminocyclopropane-1-carboxylate synthase-like protein 2 n=1 Tax=Erinaceus europaeus TaxID=9365 RepID=A0A1S3A9T5_ERIEU|nr:probable inactive 1-aminocyclopropane-1-carboxylate synthase-like protein 2 [Erinaceus europaeus]
MSYSSDTLCTPGDPSLKSQGAHTEVLERMGHLTQSIEEHIGQLSTGHQQLEAHSPGQGPGEQEALLSHQMGQVVSLLQSETNGLLPHPLDSRVDIGAGQPGPFTKPTSDCETTLVSHDLSNRGNDISTFYHTHFRNYILYHEDKYHEDKNPSGFINLATCQNKLCTDLITERLSREDMNIIEDTLLQYPDWRGHPFLREEVARFLTHYSKAPAQLDPENVVVLNGCCPVLSALAMVLCEPGEAFLTPAPFYGTFVFSTSLYAKVELIHVYLDSEITEGNTRPFQLTVDKLEHTLLEAQLKGKKVRGLVLTNPQNPLGDVYSRDSLIEYLEFAKRYNLHVIVDEIYMLSVFDESTTFHSVLSIKSLPDPKRTHVIWGTSKCFGICGFRFGALYTHNKEVASAVSSFGYFHSISGIAQHKLCRLLQDREWIDQVYLPISHSRLQVAHRYITDKLKELQIPYLHRGAGLYVWINLKKYLDPCTFEQELLLLRRFLDKKVIVGTGKFFLCKEPGWFRLVFAERYPQLKLAMDRFCQVLAEQQLEKQPEDTMRM